MMKNPSYDYVEGPAESQMVDRSPVDAAENTMSLASAMADRVEAMVNRLCGSAPTAAASGNVEKLSQSGIFPSLKDKADRTANDIYSANRALDRLERQLS